MADPREAGRGITRRALLSNVLTVTPVAILAACARPSESAEVADLKRRLAAAEAAQAAQQPPRAEEMVGNAPARQPEVQTEPTWLPFTIGQYPIEFRYPPSWTRTQRGLPNDFMLAGDNRKGVVHAGSLINPNSAYIDGRGESLKAILRVFTEPTGFKTVDELMVDKKPALLDHTDILRTGWRHPAQLLEARAEVAGLPAWVIEGSDATYSVIQDYQMALVVFPQQRVGLTLIYSTHPSESGSGRELFTRLLRTFKVKA